MGRHDKAPIGNTCPDIDEALQWLNNVEIDVDAATNALASDLNYQLKKVRDRLEALRTDNERLRDWGNKECERADEAEALLADAESQIRYLNDQIHDLETQND